MVIAPGNQADWGKLVDVNMLVMTGGRECSAAEFQALFTQAGFQAMRIVPTQSFFSVIEAVKG
jgi:hypothetical protein